MKLSIPLDRFLARARNDHRLLPSHISLFVAIFYHSRADTPDASFHVSRNQLMKFSAIRSKTTYHKCVQDLTSYGYIEYESSYHPKLASKIAMRATFSAASNLK